MSVTVTRHPMFEVAKVVEQEGYVAGGITGIRGRPSKDGLSLLLDRPPERGFFGPKPVRARFVGTLWFQGCFNRQVTPKVDGPWLIEVYGENNMERIKLLAEKLAMKFNMNVVVDLDECEECEEYWLGEVE